MSMNHDPRVMIVAGSQITQDADGFYVVGDREFYLEWLGAEIADPEPELNADGTMQESDPPTIPRPTVRQNSGREEMLIKFSGGTSEAKTISYKLIW